MPVPDLGGAAGQCRAQRDRISGPQHTARRGDHRFGGTVGVDQRDIGPAPGFPELGALGWRRFATQDTESQVLGRLFRLPGVTHPGVPIGRRQVHHADAVAFQKRRKSRDRSGVRAAQDHGGARDQGGPNLLQGRIEAGSGELQHAVRGDDVVATRGGAAVFGQAAVGDPHSLGRTAGSRSVDQIGRQLGRRLRRGSLVSGGSWRSWIEQGHLGGHARGAAIGQQQCRPAVRRDLCHLFGWTIGFQRHVHRPRFEKGEHGDQIQGIPSAEYDNEVAGGHARRPDIRREIAGGSIQGRVGRAGTRFIHDGDGLRGTRHRAPPILQDRCGR